MIPAYLAARLAAARPPDESDTGGPCVACGHDDGTFWLSYGGAWVCQDVAACLQRRPDLGATP